MANPTLERRAAAPPGARASSGAMANLVANYGLLFVFLLIMLVFGFRTRPIRQPPTRTTNGLPLILSSFASPFPFSVVRGPRPSWIIDSWGRVAERGYNAGRFTYVGLRRFARSFTLLGAGLVATPN